MREVRIVPWSAEDFALLERLMGDPEMTRHLGGPEPHEKIVERQARYAGVGATGTGRMFKIMHGDEGVGSVGYWSQTWRDGEVYETGWSVLPESQGRGYATAATRLALDVAREDGRYRFVHAFPSADNAASNAMCKKLGFTLLGACDVEYPKGRWMRAHDWRLDLRPDLPPISM